MIASPAFAKWPPDGISVGLEIEVSADDGTIIYGPQLSYIKDLYDRNWSAKLDASVFAPFLIHDLREGTYSNALGTLNFRTTFIVDPPGGLSRPELPGFDPYGEAGIELILGKGKPKLNYNVGVYIGDPDQANVKIDLPVLKYEYDIGKGSRFSHLFSSLDLFGPKDSCTPTPSPLSPLAPPSGLDCSFTRATLNLSSSAIPESSTWAMGLIGFALVGGKLRIRRRKTPHAIT